MKIFLIGATGKTGKEVIKQGLEQGHVITALVRNPDNLKIRNPNLFIVKGNVLQAESFENALHGQDVVISSLGHKRFFIPTNILSEGTKNVIESMRKKNIKRFICISSLGVNDSRFKLGLYYTLFAIPFILLFYFLDKSKQEKLIMNSDLDWTIIRPGQLTNGKKRTDYRYGPSVGSYILTRMISRASVAHFVLNQTESKAFVGKAIGIID